jgi:hypothetical protein
MTECSRTLARWGEKTTRNADKVLNRTLIIHRAETGPADERLFSSLLVEFAARIQQCMDAMEDLFSRLDAMHAISFDDNPQANSELEVARKLSFAAVATDTELGREEEYFVRRMAIEIANLSGAISHFASQLSLNSDAAPSILLELRNSWIKTEAIRLFHYTWPGAASLVTGEVSRLHIMMSLHSISSALADVESETSALTPGKIASMPITALRQRTEFVRGALVADAMLAGLDAGEATDAVVAMVAYAEKHDLASHEIIVSELQKIHPSLMPRTLHYFQNLTEIDPVAGKKSSEKSESASRSRTLLDYFSTKSRKLASSPLAMLVLAFVLSASAIGCGLKTATRSDVDDLRPEIPFKNK